MFNLWRAQAYRFENDLQLKLNTAMAFICC